MMRYLLTMLLCLALPVAGIAGGAVNFDGVDDYVTISNAPAISGDYSLSLWLNGEDIQTQANYFFSMGYNNENSFLFYQDGTTDDVIKIVEADASVGVADILVSDITLLDNTWYHLTFVRESGVYDIYLNGIDEYSDSAPNNLNISSMDWTMGWARPRDNAAAYFNGSIDEVLIYNVALTAEEIAAMYASTGAWYPKRGLAPRWSMENNGVSTGQAHANGSTIKDSFGSNDGTISDTNSTMTLVTSPVRQKRGRR